MRGSRTIRAFSDAVRHAASRGPKSGRRALSIGVGTTTTMQLAWASMVGVARELGAALEKP